MRIVSVNVSMPCSISGTARGTVISAIDKHPVSGSVDLTFTNLAGDGQGDLLNHGGPTKAVYAYAADDYTYWRETEGLSIPDFGWFGENLTVEGGLSDEVRIGDVWEVGAARLQVTEPRSPCFKLDHKVGIPGFAARFQRTGRVGFYLRVLQQGSLSTGAEVILIGATQDAMTVRELSDFRHYGTGGRSMANRILAIDGMGVKWQRRPQKLLNAAPENQR